MYVRVFSHQSMREIMSQSHYCDDHSMRIPAYIKPIQSRANRHERYDGAAEMPLHKQGPGILQNQNIMVRCLACLPARLQKNNNTNPT